MKCWHCETELIWGGDHDCEEEDHYDIVTNLSCPKCETHVDVYHKFELPTMEKQKELFSEQEMWSHYCPEEQSEMEIGKGEDCSWCGANESSS